MSFSLALGACSLAYVGINLGQFGQGIRRVEIGPSSTNVQPILILFQSRASKELVKAYEWNCSGIFLQIEIMVLLCLSLILIPCCPTQPSKRLYPKSIRCVSFSVPHSSCWPFSSFPLPKSYRSLPQSSGSPPGTQRPSLQK